ncbi:MAG: AEC family transporter [Synechocystis sp.]|nr:AEC family transporter [Synechocystis sp.]
MSAYLLLARQLYLPILSAVLAGAGISFALKTLSRFGRISAKWSLLLPRWLGKFLYLIGVPISVVHFIRKADLSGGIWLAPITAWIAILLGLVFATLWTQLYRDKWAITTQSSFTELCLVGNTSFLGFPIALLLPQLGPNYFAWALLYDILGTFFGAYGLGVILAARSRFGHVQISNAALARPSLGKMTREVLANPCLIAFFIGLAMRPVPWPKWLTNGLNFFAWSVIMMALALIGIRLQQLDSWRNIRTAFGAVAIKMLLVPMIVGMGLTAIGVYGPPRLVLILQAGMPCAFATLVITEAYDLDRPLVVTTLGLSSLVLIFMLPFWVWGFATW